MSKYTEPDYCWLIRPIGRRLDQIFGLLRRVLRKQDDMAVELDTLKQSATALSTKVGLVVAKLQELVSQLGTVIPPAELTVVSQQLDSLAQTLQNAVDAATPPAPQA